LFNFLLLLASSEFRCT